MKFLTGLLLALFLVSACSCTSVIPARVSYMEDTRFIRGLQDGTAGLVDEDGLFCSGVFISDNEVLTAAHCLHHAAHMSLGIQDGQLALIIVPEVTIPSTQIVTRQEFNEDVEHPTNHSHLFDVIFRNNDKDLVLLRARGTYESVHATIRLPNAETQAGLVIGSSVYAIGHPAGVGWNVSHGFVSRDPLTEQGLELIVASANIFFGNSGGPLVDSNGNLVGIAHAMPGGQGGAATFIGLFISPNEIVNFMNAARAAS